VHSSTVKPGRNDPCSCGSGKKFKKCCGQETRPAAAALSSAELNRLGVLVKDGRFLDLEGLAREFLVKYPSSGLLWKLMGLSLWMQGKDALPALQKAAELLPEDAEAHGNLGNALRAAGQIQQAAKSHGRALALKPDYAEAHNNLGSVQLDLGRLDEAAASFRRALAINADFALAHSNLATVLTLQNQRMEAEASCRRALEINPRLTAAVVQLAELQADLGRFADAESLMKRAIAIEPNMPEAWAGLVRWRKMARGDSWLAEAQRILGQRLPPRREVHLRYAMGKYFDDVGDHEQAFTNFRRANELTKIGRPAHDSRLFTRAIDLIVHLHTRDWLSRARAVSSPSDRPVFIVGMPRSGTTLAEQILASHPEVFGAGELPFWNSAATTLAASRTDGGNDQNILGRLADDYVKLLSRLSPDARRVVDKMPANFLHLGAIHAALPDARIIHMRRNPIDTCLSIYFQNFGTEHFYASDLDDLACYYTEYLRLMDHWRYILPASTILEVPYEAFVEAPEAWSRTMVEFIGLPWDPKCLDFQGTTRAVSTFSKWQARQKISKSSVGRWRNYEKFLGPLMRLSDSTPGE